MKVFLALLMTLSFSTFAAEASGVGEKSAQAIDCEKILASQGKGATVQPQGTGSEPAKTDTIKQ